MVHRIGKNDIDHIDRRVVGNAVECFVIINVGIGNIVLRFPPHCLLRCARHNAGKVTRGRFLQCSAKDGGVVAEADQSDS